MAKRRPKNPTTLTAIDELDPRTSEALALKAWRADLLNDLGGEEGLTLMARELVEQATRLKLYLDRMDAPALPKRGETVSPYRDRRMQVRKMLVDVMDGLGMKPEKKVGAGKKSNVPSLEDIRARYSKKAPRPA